MSSKRGTAVEAQESVAELEERIRSGEDVGPADLAAALAAERVAELQAEGARQRAHEQHLADLAERQALAVDEFATARVLPYDTIHEAEVAVRDAVAQLEQVRAAALDDVRSTANALQAAQAQVAGAGLEPHPLRARVENCLVLNPDTGKLEPVSAAVWLDPVVTMRRALDPLRAEPTSLRLSIDG